MIPHFARLLKGAVVRDGVIANGGYAIVDRAPEESGVICFDLEIRSSLETRFVFGFKGVGWHNQCWLRPDRGEVRLYSIRDGIRIYRNHALVSFGVGDRLEIEAGHFSIRIKLNRVDLIHILADDAGAGGWGFTGPRGQARSLVPVTVSESTTTDLPRWLVLGDGYTNPAWPLRHFVGWPELLFGGRHDYLNAAVPAGNSLRVGRILAKFVRERLAGSQLVFAVGADDFLEGLPIGESQARLEALGSDAVRNGAESVAFATIPARLSGNDQVVEWNGMIRSVADKRGFQVIDFFQAMIDRMDEDLIGGGDYPAERAQALMAEEAASVLGLEFREYPLRGRLLGTPAMTFKRRLLLKAYGKLKSRLGADETV